MDMKELKRLIATAKFGDSPIKSADYVNPLDQDTMKVKSLSKELPEPVTRIKGMTDKIDTKVSTPILKAGDHVDKIAKLRALKATGKKVAGVIPYVGAGMAALSGDPAMAAEELAVDAMGPAGIVYEALKPDVAGEPLEDEFIRLAEDKARKAYDKSPARMGRLKALMGGNNE